MHHIMKWYQMDVKSVFLNGFINELIYIDQPPRFEDLDILIMFIGCPRHYMGLSKPQELGMSAFGTSSLRRASPSGRSTPHYSPRSLMEISSFVKCMLMISSLDHQMKILAKSLVNWCRMSSRCLWLESLHSFLVFKSSKQEKGFSSLKRNIQMIFSRDSRWRM